MIAKSGRSIPVLLAPPRSGAPDNFVSRAPATVVHVACGDTSTHNGKSYYAMIDTGADSSAIDPSVAEATGAVLFGSGIAHGFGTPQATVKAANVSIIFPTINLTYHCPRIAVMDFHMAQQPWDILLGRDFLKHCRFELDGPNGRYRLEWIQ